LLGVHYNHVSSFPVGYVDRLTLYPLDFEEFLNALNQNELFKITKENYLNGTKVENLYHEKMLDLFIKYIVIGGMPEVIKTYVETNDYLETFNNQQRIVNDYKDDIAKYASSSEKAKAREIFDSIPFQLAKDNKKFQYSQVKKGGRSSDYNTSIKWLIDANIIYKANLLTNIEIPLITYSKPDHFKIYLMDTGLLVSMLGLDAQKLLLMNELGIAKGAIYENVIATILTVNNHKLYYFERQSGLEIDFITSKNIETIAVEVKSGENTNSHSLKTILNENLVSYGIRLSRKNYSIQDKIKSLPLYFSIFI
jgi:predicted AAA+ superfamily ATPase